MSRKTEKIFKEFDKNMDENNNNSIVTSDDLDNLISDFMSKHMAWNREVTEENAESSDDYLELAESAETKKEALKYAKKAVELDPDNIDALVMVTELTSSTFEKFQEKLKKMIENAEEKLKADGLFAEECIGHFWGILETRPYMRLLDKYTEGLIYGGQMRLAVASCEKMLKLCEGDNLGKRYTLMHLYVFLEDEQSALELFKKYSDEEESTQFYLPLSLLYYKLGNLREANNYLKKLCEINEDTYKFFGSLFKGDLKIYKEDANPFGYSPDTIEEFLVEAKENSFLFTSAPLYFAWGWDKLKSKNKK